MESNNKQNNLPRRKFLETGVTAGLGLALGLAIVHSVSVQEEGEMPEMIKMLTPDGKLVEVEKRHLPPMCGNPVAVSNQELQQWMEKGKE